MSVVYLDASAAVKRFVVEKGTSTMNALWRELRSRTVMMLGMGVAELVSILVRKRNGGLLPNKLFKQSMIEVDSTILRNKEIIKVTANWGLVASSLQLISEHAINATDAAVLQSCIDVNAFQQTQGSSVILVTADKRLEKAAISEGLTTINPETVAPEEIERCLT